jgi:hypothetical protein
LSNATEVPSLAKRLEEDDEPGDDLGRAGVLVASLVPA